LGAQREDVIESGGTADVVAEIEFGSKLVGIVAVVTSEEGFAESESSKRSLDENGLFPLGFALELEALDEDDAVAATGTTGACGADAFGPEDGALETTVEAGFAGRERLKAASAAALLADIWEEAFAIGLEGAGESREVDGVDDTVHECAVGCLCVAQNF